MKTLRSSLALTVFALFFCGVWRAYCEAGTGQPPATERKAGEQVFLKVWHKPPKGHSDPIWIARRRIVETFLRQNKDISLEHVTPLQIEGPGKEGREFLAVAGGVAPDIFYLDGRKIGDYRAQGFLYPLNEFLSECAERRGEPYSGINSPDSVWELCHDRDKIVCVPHLYYSMALICNRELFARAGLPERAPENWQELYDFARRLTWDPYKEPDADPNDRPQYGFKIQTGLYAGGYFLQWVWSSGGEVVESFYPAKDGRLVEVPPPPVDYAKFHIRLSNQKAYDARRKRDLAWLAEKGVPTEYSVDDLKWRLVTDREAAMKALLFYRKLVHQPWMRVGDHEFDLTPDMIRNRTAVDPVTGERFDLDDPEVARRVYHGVADAVAQQSGQSRLRRARYGMVMGVIDEADTREPGEYLSFPFPSRTGEGPAALIAGRYMGINSTITASGGTGRRSVEAIRRAAWRFIEFCTGPEAQHIRVETFVEYGLEEYVRPAVLKNAGYTDILERIPPERRKLWDNLLSSARVEPYCDGFTHVKTRELGAPIEALVNDEPDPLTGAYRRDLQELMDATVERVNTMILGEMPEEEVQRRARVGWIVFALMVAALALGGFLIVRIAIKAQQKWRDNEGFGVGGASWRRRCYAWAFLTPAVVTILIWKYYPLAKGMVMAFLDYKILGDSAYVGLRNFIEVACSHEFWRYLLQTAEYVVLTIGIGFCVPIILAVLLTEIPKGKVLYRVIYYLPAVTTGLVTLFLWKNLLYDPTSNGVINRLILWFNEVPTWAAAILKGIVLIGFLAVTAGLVSRAFSHTSSRRERVIAGVIGGVLAILAIRFFAVRIAEGGVQRLAHAFWSPFGFHAQKFLRDPKLAMLWCVVPGVWASAGAGCLIYLAALKGIPEEQYEAADLDGAGVWGKFWNVTFPNLHALIIINFVGAVIGAFHASSNIFVMTGGGPENATMTIGLEIWYNAFLYLKFGTATAMAWIMGALLIGFTLNQLRILNKLQFRSAAVEEAAAGGRA